MLNPVRMGIAGGIVTALWMAIATMLAMYCGWYALPYLEMMAYIYPCYTVSCCGIIVGIIWGFIHGFFSFFLLIWLYNHIGECHCTPKCKKKRRRRY